MLSLSSVVRLARRSGHCDCACCFSNERDGEEGIGWRGWRRSLIFPSPSSLLSFLLIITTIKLFTV